MGKHRTAFLLICILAGLLAGVGLPAAAQDSTPTPTAALTTIEQHGLFEINVPVEGQYQDPSNSQQVEVTARFVAPDGAQVAVPGFWMQPQQQTCSQSCSIEVIRPLGGPVWRVRFSPDRVGEWRYQVEVRDTSAVRTAAQGRFVVTASQRPGLIRARGRYFAHENGASYFPVGSNLGWSWSGSRNTPGYQEWLKQLSATGANYARLYIDVPWFIGLGWRNPANGATSFQEDAWRLDTLLRTAEEQGIALQLVLLWHQGWITFGGLPVNVPSSPPRPNTDADWFSNPYNVQRGGPFPTATQFFVSNEGRRIFRDRLRYIVARWGYSGSVFAWEIIDQLDRVTPNAPETASLWLREMASYLRQIDPYDHPITAGVRDSKLTALLDSAALDFREARYYQRRPIEEAGNQVSGLLDVLMPMLSGSGGSGSSSNGKPALVNEFSLNPWFEPTADDPEGIHVLTTMWASAFSGAAGAAAPWWWDTYLFPQNLVPALGPLAAFTRPIPWAENRLQPANVTLTSQEPITYQPLRISGYTANFGETTPPDQIFRVTPDGIYPPISTASAFLYGVTFNAQLSRPQQYIIAPPVNTRLKINVARVSERASVRLVVIVDGEVVSELSLGPKSPPSTLTIPIHAGEHLLVVDNLGEDFLQIESIEIAEYISPLRVLALADRESGMLLAWAQHRDYTWQNGRKPITPLTATMHVSAMPVGLYRVELWDPLTGNVIGQEEVMVASSGTLNLDLLPISTMLAVRAVRVAEPGNLPSATPTATPTPRIPPTATPTRTATPTPSVTPSATNTPLITPSRTVPPVTTTPNVVG